MRLPLFAKVIDEFDLEIMSYDVSSAGGNRAINILIQTAAGKKIVKQYKPTLGKSTIIQEHAILKYLDEINFPAPRLFATKSGESLVECDNRYFAIFDFIEHDYKYNNYFLFPRQQKRFIQIAAEILAELHDELKNFEPQGHNPDGFKSKNSINRWRGLDWYLEKLNGCVERCSTVNSKKKDCLLLARSQYLGEEINRLDKILNHADLPRLINHGDYGPYNLLFRNNGEVFVLDFEMARLEWRLVEVIRAWYRFCCHRLGYNLSQMKLFLNSYQAHMPMTTEEFRLLPEVWKFINLRGVIRSWDAYLETFATKLIDDAHRCLTRIDWINTNQHNIKQYFKTDLSLG